MERGDKLLTIPEAAALVGVTRAVLWRHVKAGHIPHTPVGKFLLIDQVDAEHFRDNRPKPGRPKVSGLTYPQSGDHATGRLLRAADRAPEYRAD